MATPPDFTDGTALAASSLNAIGLWKITPTVSGTGMSVSGGDIIMSDVSDGEIRNIFTSDFRHYRMIVQYNSSTTLGINMRMLSGTSTVDSGSVYTYAAVGWVSNGTNYTDNAELQTSFPLGGGGSNDGGSAYKIMDFIGPNLAGRTWLQNDGGFEWTTNLVYTRRYACLVDTATQYTGIKFYTSSGNIDGTIQLYGWN